MSHRYPNNNLLSPFPVLHSHIIISGLDDFSFQFDFFLSIELLSRTNVRSRTRDPTRTYCNIFLILTDRKNVKIKYFNFAI